MGYTLWVAPMGHVLNFTFSYKAVVPNGTFIIAGRM